VVLVVSFFGHISGLFCRVGWWAWLTFGVRPEEMMNHFQQIPLGAVWESHRAVCLSVEVDHSAAKLVCDLNL
jgi:hypothetical protein